MSQRSLTLIPRRSLLVLLGCLLTASAMASEWPTLNRLAQSSTDKQADAQRQVEQLDDAAQKHFAEYRAQLIELEGLRAYNRQLKALREEQESALNKLDEHIQDTGRLDRKIVPLMEDMYVALDLFIEEDMPFLEEERSSRLTRLRHILDDPEIPLASKYRSLYEAYQIELDYGRTLQTYTDTLSQEGEPLSVTVLRVGRVALFAMSGDRQHVFLWDRETQDWQRREGIARYLQQAIRMANKQAAPNLLMLPIARPEDR